MMINHLLRQKSGNYEHRPVVLYQLVHDVKTLADAPHLTVDWSYSQEQWL